MNKGEERTACKGRILIRKVYNKGMCLNLFEDHQDFVKVSSAIVTMLLTRYSQLRPYTGQKETLPEKSGSVPNDSRSVEQYL